MATKNEYDAIREYLYDIKKHNNYDGQIIIVPSCDESEENSTYYGEIGAKRIKKLQDFLLKKSNWKILRKEKDFAETKTFFKIKGIDTTFIHEVSGDGKIVSFNEEDFDEVKNFFVKKF